MSIWQTLIALDQLANTFIDDTAQGGHGWADETISSRAWRLSGAHPRWERMRRLVDWAFLRLRGQRHHCFEAWVAERMRLQLPPEMRANTAREN